MFRKIIFIFLTMIIAVKYAHAAGAGIFATVGSGSQSIDFNVKINDSNSIGHSSVDGIYLLVNFGIFYEISGLFGMSDNNFLGISAGYQKIQDDEITANISDWMYDFNNRLTAYEYMIPVTIYYKYKINEKFAMKGGLGFTYISLDWKRKTRVYSNSSNTVSNITNTVSESKIMPHIDTGVEWIFSRFVTLGGELSYGFNGVISSDYANPIYTEKYKRDFSGLVVKVILKFYVVRGSN
ncbi:MAG: outer membrane beta-barrel protein [Endomicrobia bacterium]|nr:outer membrane beta-barrel protein [Endomicrobiia bacterium]